MTRVSMLVQSRRTKSWLFLHRHLVVPKRSLFGKNNFCSPSFLQAQWRKALTNCEELRKDIAQSVIDECLITKLDNISNEICVVADACNFISSYHSCRNVASAAEEIYFQAVSYVESLNTDTALYVRIKALKDDHVWTLLDGDSKHAVNMFIDEFEKSGMQLDAEKRNLFVDTSNAILKAGNSFVEAANQPSKISLRKCPTPLLNLIHGNSSLSLFETHLNSRYDDVREAGWKLYHRFDKSREEKLLNLLKQRQKLATLSGFENHCERELRGSIAKCPSTVQDFLNELNYQLQHVVSKEINLFSEMKRTREPVGIWDVSYYAVESRSKFLQAYHETFQNKLNLKIVVDALNRLSQHIFDVELVCEPIVREEAWHTDVHKYVVRNQCGKTLGIIYCDFYKRPGKAEHICLHTIQCGTVTQIPIVVLVCNFEKVGNIQMSDVSLLFHEYGHALHAVLGRTRYQHVSGTRCPTDFAEIPSILLESIVNQSGVMEALFNSTGKTSELHTNLSSFSLSDCYNSVETQVQLYYAMLDHLLHSVDDIQDTREIASMAQEKYLGQFSIPASTAWHQRFSHLYFYGGRYYSYLWAQAIVNMIIEQQDLKEKLHKCPEIRALFEQGGSRDCSLQIESLLGESLSIEKMVASLVKPLDSFNALIQST